MYFLVSYNSFFISFRSTDKAFLYYLNFFRLLHVLYLLNQIVLNLESFCPIYYEKFSHNITVITFKISSVAVAFFVPFASATQIKYL